MSPRRIGTLVLVVALILCAASIASQYIRYHTVLGSQLSGASGGLLRVFHANDENSIPTWFSIVSLLISCALLFVIAHAARARDDRFARHWAWLAALFLLLSIDEGASLHELATRPLREAFGASGWHSYTWVVPGLLFCTLVALVYSRFLFSLPVRTRRLFALGAVTFTVGAIGVEGLGGWYDERNGSANMSYAILTATEECLEMLGTGIFVYALLDYLERHAGTVELSIGEGRRSPSVNAPAADEPVQIAPGRRSGSYGTGASRRRRAASG